MRLKCLWGASAKEIAQQVVKSPDCSSGAPEMDSYHLHWGVQLSETPVPGYPIPFSGLFKHCLYMVHRHMSGKHQQTQSKNKYVLK